MKKIKQTLTSILILCLVTVGTFKANAQAPTITKTIGYPIGANISCYGIAYGATKYAAITYNGDVYTSADGDNWSKSASLGESLNQITFANSLFVVCGENGYIATSTDAITWTKRTTGTTNTLVDVQYLQNVFYAVGQNRTILSSSNGTTWSAVTVSSGTATDFLTQIVYGGGKYIIMANSSTGQGPMTYQSTTAAGNSWSAIGGFGVFGNTHLNKIAYLNSQFILITSSTAIFTSSNGTSWSNISGTMTVTNPNSTTAAVGNGNYFNNVYYNAGTYYWVGYSNYNGGAYGAIFTSTNLTALTLQANPINIIANKSYYLNGKHFIAGNEGFATSSNGTAYAFPYGSFNSLAFNGTTYVGVGSPSLSGGVFSSTTFEGNTWVNRSLAGQRPLYGVVHDGSKFVAVGDKTVISSTDGSTWSSLATPTDVFTCLAYGGSKYVVGGYAADYSSYFLKYSSNGTTWTTANSTSITYFKVRYVNGVFFALGIDNDYPASSGVIMRSTDGITWTNVTPTGLAFNVYVFSDVTWDGTKYHFTGADAAYAFFSISTATPTTTSSYSNKATISNLPSGVVLGYTWNEGCVSYSGGKYVGSVIDVTTYETYLVYSSNGTSWTSVATNDKSVVSDIIVENSKFRMVGTGDEKITVAFAPTNTAPTFTNATNTLSVCQNAAATSINSLLQITDTDASQTETFSVATAPNNGGSITAGTTVASGTNVSPTGWSYTPANGFSGTETFTIQVSDGTVTASKTITVTVNQTTAPTASAQTFCNDATIANLVATGTALQWYAASTGGSALATTTSLATETYYVSQTVSGCESSRTAVAVTANTTLAPTASAQTFCSGATVANLLASPGVAARLAPVPYKWYTASTGGTALATSTALATGTYYVSQTLNNCESSRTAVAVTVNTTLAPTASAQTFCSGATVANLLASPGVAARLVPVSYKWYTASTGGTSLATSTALATGTYYVSQTLNSCESTRTAVSVTVNTTSAPTASAQTFCSGATVDDLVATGTALQWYNVASGGTALATATVLSSGDYFVSQTINGCESARTPIAVILTPLTENVTTLSVCDTYTWTNNGQTYTTSGVYTGLTANCVTEKLNLTITNRITPEFTAVTPICAGGSLAALPTTSNNGITGTWSPALDNTTTTTYTFTPDAGECATTTTLSINVNPNVTPTFTEVAPICAGESLAALPTTSNDCISGTWSPALNNLATTTYTFLPNAGQCASITTLTITVNPIVTPTFTQVAAICSGASLSALPTTSNNAIAGTWSPALNNMATTTYTFTPATGQCANTATMTINVNDGVAPTFTQVAAICSGASLSALPTTSNNGITGTWTPALDNTATTSYTFTPDAGQCAVTAFMTIAVNNIVTTTFTQVAPICSGATLSALPTTSNNGITGTWSPALNNTATTTYTFTPAIGQCGTTATMTIAVTTTPAPIALSNQRYSGVATLANLSVTGTAIQWYNGASGGSVLPASTALVDGTTYFVSQTLGSCESARTAVTVNIEIPNTLTFCNEARVADAVGTSTLKFYQFLTGSSALAARTLLTTRTYFVTQVINGIESSPRVPVGVTLNPLPARIAAITASDDNLCKYIGTTNTVTYTATPGALSYIWTVPAGVTIIGSQDTNILTVNFQAATISGAGIIGNIVVRGVNAIGCASGPERAITLSTLLPTQPLKATLTHNGVVQTTVGNFVGDSTKTLVLEATDNSNTANRYTWELPEGVSVVSGDATADRIISINLSGVAPGNTDLVFKVSSVAGCGTSAARSVAVTRSAPGSPRALVLTDDAISSVNPILIVSGYTGKFKTTPLTLTATPRTGTGIEATSYKWVLPSGIGIIDASATFVSENSGFKTYTSTANAIKINLSGVGTATSLLLNVFGVNGNGESLLSRDLTLTSAIPARPGTLTSASGGTATYHPTCGTITVRIPNVFGVTYTWSVKGGAMATIPSTNSNGNEATINVSQLPTIVNSSFRIGVIASNGTGSSSETIYTIRLGSACSVGKIKANDDNTAKVTNEFKVIAYPNPSSNVFTIKIQSLDEAKTELSVYDTAGRLVEKLQAQTNEVDLGSKYPAGVYNLIVKQGENVKTVRVVKK